MKKVITYGSFDLFHEGHFRLLQRAKALEDIDARYVGLLKFSKGGLEHILALMNAAYAEFEEKPWQQSGKTVRKAYMTDLLQAVIESGRPVRAERFNNGWIEFDTNEDYENASKWVEDGSIAEIINL